jgi:hypothetical protein
MAIVHIKSVGTLERTSQSSPWGTEEKVEYRYVAPETGGHQRTINLLLICCGFVAGIISNLLWMAF